MLTQNRLKELVSYDPATGVLERIKAFRGTRLGVIRGTKDKDGYLKMQIDFKTYRFHRLAWLYVTGNYDSDFDINHINRVRDDNRFDNLEAIPHVDNCRSKNMQKNNTSGYTCVKITNNNRYHVSVGRNYIGTYDTIELALEARGEAFVRLGYNENHGQ